MATDSSRYLSDLHRQINKYFNLEDVRSLCFELGIDFDNVAGENKSGRIRELILQMARREELQQLIDLLRQERPNAVWVDVPADFSLPGGLEQPEAQPPANNNYYGPVTFNQQNQTVEKQFNITGGANIDHIGDNVQGDKVGGDKTGGDKITVGDISGSSGIAIGAGARAEVVTSHTPTTAADLTAHFAPLQIVVDTLAPALSAKVGALQAEAGRGAAAEDAAVAGLLQDLATGLPAAAGLLKPLMANPAVAPAANGPATKFVLGRL